LHEVKANWRLGNWVYLHTSAAGKAILAELPEEKVHRIIDEHGMPARTEHTITDRDELLTNLEKVRNRGYSLNKEENTPGLHAIGIPVKGPRRGIVGALSISGPSHRLKEQLAAGKLRDLVLGIENELELNIAQL